MDQTVESVASHVVTDADSEAFAAVLKCAAASCPRRELFSGSPLEVTFPLFTIDLVNCSVFCVQRSVF